MSQSWNVEKSDLILGILAPVHQTTRPCCLQSGAPGRGGGQGLPGFRSLLPYMAQAYFQTPNENPFRRNARQTLAVKSV